MEKEGEDQETDDSFCPFHNFFQSQLSSLYMLGLYQLIQNIPRVGLHIKNFRIMYE